MEGAVLFLDSVGGSSAFQFVALAFGHFSTTLTSLHCSGRHQGRAVCLHCHGVLSWSIYVDCRLQGWVIFVLPPLSQLAPVHHPPVSPAHH